MMTHFEAWLLEEYAATSIEELDGDMEELRGVPFSRHLKDAYDAGYAEAKKRIYNRAYRLD